MPSRDRPDKGRKLFDQVGPGQLVSVRRPLY
jgi:hypothetical protein